MNIKKYHKIDEVINEYGKFELWEHNVYGDEVPALVTLNGVRVGETYDYLRDFIICEYDYFL